MPQEMPKVLLIESEYRLRLRYKSLFKKSGFELAGEAADLAAADGLAKECGPGVVLLHMGGELTDTARLAKLASLLPVLVLGKASPGLASLGVYGCLPEGAEDAEILTSLAIAAARWQEARSLRQEAEELRDLLALRKILDQAKVQIAAEKESALRDVRKEVAVLSVAVAEKVLRKDLENDASRDELLGRLVDELSSSKDLNS